MERGSEVASGDWWNVVLRAVSQKHVLGYDCFHGDSLNRAKADIKLRRPGQIRGDRVTASHSESQQLVVIANWTKWSFDDTRTGSPCLSSNDFGG